MAIIQVNLMSECLVRPTPVNVILPVDKLQRPGTPKRPEKPYKTLYLLHGIFGNYTDWYGGTRIMRYAEEHNLAVVMPSGDNAFYVDQPAANNYYGQFIGQELVDLTRKMFPLSREREDTFIGGLSMGGYGALRNGLKYSDTFGYITALSSALVIEGFPERTNDSPMFMERRDFAEALFGDVTNIRESDANPKYLIRQLKEQGKEIPKIYMACGESDSLLPLNKDLYDFLKTNDVDATFVTGPGNHEWDFWDAYIKKAIEWLPTEDKDQGINSGNIGL